jgi:hypothetical protein
MLTPLELQKAAWWYDQPQGVALAGLMDYVSWTRGSREYRDESVYGPRY